MTKERKGHGGINIVTPLAELEKRHSGHPLLTLQDFLNLDAEKRPRKGVSLN